MKKIFLLILISFLCFKMYSQAKTIHVYVALCDNENQGIVPVPKKLGNGKDPKHNLYWGAGYGIKSFFKFKAKDWKLVKDFEMNDSVLLDRVLFKHVTKKIYLLADAYDGAKIQTCIEDFLQASNAQNPILIDIGSETLKFGGGSDLLSYIGHDGLMEFNVHIPYKESVTKKRDVIILACYSQNYFSKEIEQAKANPILWTTHLMAPEAYTLKSAIDGWIKNETGKQIEERAAQTYNTYQKCGIKGARNLFTTGFKN
ncbi:hypothetical protein [Aquimarina sp. MAR_2010_214]|uniref:hypothetical protein n=1 Tax=Aquimarina sp. MAR_2010_214 TaxID=1250026 RepID=UPI000C702881|nr:hypothetical protein [Aquimarina sp. MAR_2010_214]